MPYALRVRKGDAPISKASSKEATSPVSKKNHNNVIAQIKDMGESSLKTLKKTVQGGVKKRVNPQVKANAIKAHSRVIKQIQKTMSPSKPSEAKQRMKTAKTRESVTAQIAKRAVIKEVKALGTGSPIKRVAKNHVKSGVDLRSVSGGRVHDTRSGGAKRAAALKKTKTEPKKLQKAVQSEIKRIGAKTPTEAKMKREVAQKFSAVKTEIKKRAVLQEIKKVGSTRLKKSQSGKK
ncbi:hypothetical protein HDU67_001028 [Dinochytrium kinnereticum]|nr:hypothetical protein HDU67_001028 [Dinochytrium kinnereticum]